MSEQFIRMVCVVLWGNSSCGAFAVIIFITPTLFGFTVHATGKVLGSPERMYENLTYMAQVQLSCTSCLTVSTSTANADTMVTVLLMLVLFFVPVLTLCCHHLNFLGHTVKTPA